MKIPATKPGNARTSDRRAPRPGRPLFFRIKLLAVTARLPTKSSVQRPALKDELTPQPDQPRKNTLPRWSRLRRFPKVSKLHQTSTERRQSNAPQQLIQAFNPTF